MRSVFTDKQLKPGVLDLEKALGTTVKIWADIENFTLKNSMKAKGEWNFSGEKFGWSYRIKDSKRVLVYLLPRAGFFKVAFVFGEKAFHHILESDIDDAIKTELQQAKKYMEGRGIRLEVKNHSKLEDIKKLISIKLAN